MSQTLETLLPLLVYIQANLDGDLSLDRLSEQAQLSPWHLHRLFTSVVGETPKAYTERLRLERAAFRLLIHQSGMLDIALDCGFHNPETFSRAFRRRFGRSPSTYRQSLQRQVMAAVEPRKAPGTLPTYRLSQTAVRRLRPATLAFIRHLGPYESVSDSLFDELGRWAERSGLAGPRVWMGIGHDAPSSTAPQRLRFDAALVVPELFAARGRVGCQVFAGGEFAVTTHAGSFDTLPQAYTEVFSRLMSLPGYRPIGLPAVEVYHSARVNAELRLNHTDICLPVQREAGLS